MKNDEDFTEVMLAAALLAAILIGYAISMISH
jgi:hypothetical protein